MKIMKIVIVIAIFGMISKGAAAEKGTVYRVNFEKKSFALLKKTAYDPKKPEGSSFLNVYWNEKTTFTKQTTQKSLEGIKTGPVVASILVYGNKAKPEKAITAKAITLFPEATEEPTSSKSYIRGWFKPDSKKKNKGVLNTLYGKKLQFTLRRKGTVFIDTPASAEILKDGLFSATISGKLIGCRFIASSMVLQPLPDPKATDDPKLPRVLVIGDSISMNYHEAAKEALKGKVNYHRCTGNGGDSNRGLQNMTIWLGDFETKGSQWDVIQFNHGLHDLKQGNKGATHQVEIEKYKANLETEIQRLKKVGAKLIWCTTTPVPAGGATDKRKKDADLVYNKAAMEVMSKHPEIQITDLNTLVRESSVFNEWRKGTNVHYGKSGRINEVQALGNAVADGIMKMFGK